MGKTQLAERLGARLDATVILDDRDNPFLGEFYRGRPGGDGWAKAVPEVTSPADIAIDSKRGLLVIPVFQENRVEMHPVPKAAE